MRGQEFVVWPVSARRRQECLEREELGSLRIDALRT